MTDLDTQAAERAREFLDLICIDSLEVPIARVSEHESTGQVWTWFRELDTRLSALVAALQTAEAERDNWKREAEARRERKVLCEDLASKLRAAETREKTLLALVVEAYDEWGDEGHPSNAWRKKAETLGACAALSGTGTGQ